MTDLQMCGVVVLWLIVGCFVVGAWMYVDPWSKYALESPLPVVATLAWPATLAALALSLANARGKARKARLAHERIQRELEAGEVEQLLKDEGL